jgi:Zn-dependent M28 family amino/carboxypeptidase
MENDVTRALPAATFCLIIALAGCQGEAPETGVATAPPQPAKADALASIEAEGLMKHIAVLASDEFGGRAPMSEGERLTLNYLEEQFRAIGLDPMFGDSYRQPVPLVALEAMGDLGLLVRALDGSGEIKLANGPESMVWTKRVVEETGLEDSELVWAGYGIVAPEYGWDDYAGLDVTGKTVIVLVNDPGFATQNPDLFNGNAMTYYGRWTYKYEEAARQGADGILIVHETAAAGYGWNVIEDGRQGPQFDLARENGNMDRVKVEGWLQRAVAEDLLARTGHDLAALEAEAAAGSSAPIPLRMAVTVKIRNRIEFAESYNVGAVRRGARRPDEIFLYTAHWDHMGTTPHVDGAEGDFIYNGAEDNASGTSGLLEIAEAWAAAEVPVRSVGFLAVTAEESGLLGSKAYADKPAFPMHRTVGGLNMDRLNFIGAMSDIVVIGHGGSELEDILAEVAMRTGRTITPEATPEKGFYYRSDHFNFAKKGVPFLYARGGTTDRERGAEYVAQRKADYVANRYHSPADEIQDDWDLGAAIEDLHVFFQVGEQVVNSDDWPEWYAGNEFRAIREASLAP